MSGPNWKFPTLEFRICDVCTRVDEAVCIAAIFQAIIAKLWKLRRDNLTFRVYPTGADRGEQVAGRALWAGRQADRSRQAAGSSRPRADPRNDRVVLGDVIDDLGSRKEVEYAFEFWKEVPAPIAKFGLREDQRPESGRSKPD